MLLLENKKKTCSNLPAIYINSMISNTNNTLKEQIFFPDFDTSLTKYLATFNQVSAYSGLVDYSLSFDSFVSLELDLWPYKSTI